jgi:hypothetical protein
MVMFNTNSETEEVEHLVLMDCHHNCLTEIPLAIYQHTSLTTLCMKFHRIREVNVDLGQPTKLTNHQGEQHEFAKQYWPSDMTGDLQLQSHLAGGPDTHHWSVVS